MGFVTFLRKTEYADFERFMKKLIAERRIKFVSSLKALKLVSKDYTGVYISEGNGYITIFAERGKNSSVKTAA